MGDTMMEPWQYEAAAGIGAAGVGVGWLALRWNFIGALLGAGVVIWLAALALLV